MTATDTYPNLPAESPMGMPLDWAWLRGARSEWGVQPKPGPRGLTHDGHRRRRLRRRPRPPPAPLHGATGLSTSRATPPTWATSSTTRPRCGPTTSPELYEEAVARQWSATRDIPWGELRELADDVEHAICQLCTTLSEVEMIASDLPAKWMWRMNHDFVEVKMFLCTQIMDEARHTEVFRKRALANGGGLLKSRSRCREPAAHHHRSQDLHPGVGADAPARRGLRARHLPPGRADRPHRRREAHLPHVHAGRGPPRRLRHHAPPLRDRARPRRRRGDPRGTRPRRDGPDRVRHPTRPDHGPGACCWPAAPTRWRRGRLPRPAAADGASCSPRTWPAASGPASVASSAPSCPWTCWGSTRPRWPRRARRAEQEDTR